MSTIPIARDPLLTVGEVAALLNVSAAWVRQHASGEIRH